MSARTRFYFEYWVERGRAPDTVMGRHLAGNHDGPSMIRPFPPAKADEGEARRLPHHAAPR